jgi:cation diffusion facilitator CzcD-associated flavoprotein CzcO
MELRLYPASRAAELFEHDDFHGFRVVVFGSGVTEAVAAFPEAIREAEDAHVWVRADSVIVWSRNTDPDWTTEFRLMLASVESLGWYDPKNDAVKAHVEHR